MPTLEKLKARIHELVPETMELSFGCEVSRYAGEAVDTVCSITSGTDGNGKHAVRLIRFSEFGAHYDFIASTEEIEHWKILGHPITLSDVLSAMGKVQKSFMGDWAVNTRGHFVKMLISGQNIVQAERWDLSENLDSQLPAVHEFLLEIMKK